MVGGRSVVYVFADLFGSEVCSVSFVYGVDFLVEEWLCPSISMVSKEVSGV